MPKYDTNDTLAWEKPHNQRHGNALKHCSDTVLFIFEGLSYYDDNLHRKKKEILTHCGLVTPYGDTDLGQHWRR